MTPEELAYQCQPRQAYTDEIDHECVARIAAAIREAVAEERDACKAIADSYAATVIAYPSDAKMDDGVKIASRKIARDILGRGKSKGEST